MIGFGKKSNHKMQEKNIRKKLNYESNTERKGNFYSNEIGKESMLRESNMDFGRNKEGVCASFILSGC